jgi:hypothetical protein
MPIALQLVTTIVPARYFLVALRGVLLKGSGIENHLPAAHRAGSLRRPGDDDGGAAAPKDWA